MMTKVLMLPRPLRVICQVIETSENAIRVRVRRKIKKQEVVIEFNLPRALCPSIACIVGGSFYLLTQGVDPVKEQRALDKLFRNL